MPDPALLDHPFHGALLICFANDRPLRGWIADLDWRFNGHFSSLMKQQLLTGETDETVYAPLKWHDRTLHFLILGGGLPKTDSERGSLARLAFDRALLKLDELALPPLTLSKPDWNIPDEHPGAKERGLWLVN